MANLSVLKWRNGASVQQFCPFPVGGVYISASNVTPSALWPGTTWTRIAAGTFLVSSGGATTGDYAVGNTGGASGSSMSGVEFFQGTGTSGWGFINDEENHRDDVPMAQNRPHNNMPLSVAVPLWERTG